MRAPWLPTLSVLLAACLLCFGPGCKDNSKEGRNPGECADSADNDADGMFDCLDPDCAGAPVCIADELVMALSVQRR
jgi:hypothetical protein